MIVTITSSTYLLFAYKSNMSSSPTRNGVYSTNNDVQQQQQEEEHLFHCRQHKTKQQQVLLRPRIRHQCFSLICSIMIIFLVYVSVLLSYDLTRVSRWSSHAFQVISYDRHYSYCNKVQELLYNHASYKQQFDRRYRHRVSYNTVPSISSSSSSDHDHDDINIVTPSTTTTATSSSSSTISNQIKFLGKGKDAIVRLGSVLISPQNEFHHFYRQAAIFIYAMGYDSTTTTTPINNDGDNNNNESNNETYYIRGVIVDHPTPFTVPEMIPILQQQQGDNDESSSTTSTSLFQNNLIFRGGDKGHGNSVLMLHNQKHIVGCSTEIGTSGLYHGGLESIIDTVSSSTTSSESNNNNNNNDNSVDYDTNNFKFCFNYCEFTEDEIEELFLSDEDNDSWCSVEVLDPYLLLNNDWDRGDCWRYIRNTIRQQM